MKQLILAILFCTGTCTLNAQANPEKQEILYGIIQPQQLKESSYATWFIPAYDSYLAEEATIAALKKLNLAGISIEIYLGTWCGDSKREVPRFLKIMDQLAIPKKNISVIALGGADSLYKQSPLHEEAGKSIFRVPVFIVNKNGKEMNRINEYPVISLEKDLHTILSGQPYSPNYRSFSLVHQWLEDGTMLDKNSSSRGLAGLLRPLVSNEHELNSLGHLQLRHNKTAQALKIFQLNAALYPESANVVSSLGEGYLRSGDNKQAVQWLERSLEINKDPSMVKPILKMLYEARSL